jgi:hypothetical protein
MRESNRIMEKNAVIMNSKGYSEHGNKSSGSIKRREFFSR